MSDAVKCLVTDLDNTLWSGTLLESDACRMRPGVRATLLALDGRGILLSVASANEPEDALRVLRAKRLDRFFLHPQIGWGSKVQSVRTIADRLGVALDAMGFVDDEPYERERMRHQLPAVRVYDAADFRELPLRPEFHTGALTSESRARREMYQRAEVREEARSGAGMSHAAFLNHCETKMLLRRAEARDLDRILELLRRTHQLNATGVVFEPEVVASWLDDPEYRVFVAELRDRFVDYGRIGVAVCRRGERAWELVSFLLSCRVLARGISGFVLSWVERQAALEGASLFRCRYRPNKRNRKMEALYRLAGLKPEARLEDGTVIFAGEPPRATRRPAWLHVTEGAAA
jgi:FkbH-like protein